MKTEKEYKEFALKLYKEIYPNNHITVMSGYHPHFEKFIALSKKILNNDIDNIGRIT